MNIHALREKALFYATLGAAVGGAAAPVAISLGEQVVATTRSAWVDGPAQDRAETLNPDSIGMPSAPPEAQSLNMSRAASPAAPRIPPYNGN